MVRHPETVQTRLHDLVQRLRHKPNDSFTPYTACWELLRMLRSQVGGNPQYFSNWFSNRAGVSPNGYRTRKQR